jgi:hypothetical protein
VGTYNRDSDSDDDFSVYARKKARTHLGSVLRVRQAYNLTVPHDKSAGRCLVTWLHKGVSWNSQTQVHSGVESKEWLQNTLAPRYPGVDFFWFKLEDVPNVVDQVLIFDSADVVVNAVAGSLRFIADAFVRRGTPLITTQLYSGYMMPGSPERSKAVIVKAHVKGTNKKGTIQFDAAHLHSTLEQLLDKQKCRWRG